jgi:putative hydrolase of the HAD superfamily
MPAILFDLDGTLYDDRTYVKAGLRTAATHLSETYGVDTFGDMVWEYGVEHNFKTVFDRVLESYDIPMSELDNLITAYHSHNEDIQPFPEVKNVLAELPEKYKTSVVTGGKYGQEKIEQLGLSGKFDDVYITPEKGTSKHNIDPFETVLERFSVVPEQSIFVGDNPEIDFRWPNHLGMTTVWVRRRAGLFKSPETTELRPTYVIPDLSLLPAIAENH